MISKRIAAAICTIVFALAMCVPMVAFAAESDAAQDTQTEVVNVAGQNTSQSSKASSSKATTPKTGDATSIVVPAVLAMAAAGTLVVAKAKRD